MSEHNFEVESGKSIKLLTKNKVCTEDIVVSAFGGNNIPDGYIKPEGSMDITENGTFDVTEKAEVNVQVVAKPEKPYIDSSKLKYGAYMFSSTYNTDLSLLENLDTSEMVDMSFFLSGRNDLYEVPKLNTRNAKNLSYLFASTKNITGEIELDTSVCENMRNAFAACYYVPRVVLSDTSKNTQWQYMFYNMSALETIDCTLYVKDGSFFQNTFDDCVELKNIRFEYLSLTNNNLSFAQSSKLTVESLLSILNALSDNTGLATTYTVHLGSANIAKLTDEQLAIAYDKNINLD